MRVMQDDELVLLELMWNRFRRLMADVQRGTFSRTDFQPWEVEILLDATSCHLEPRRRPKVLRQYQRAVEKQMETGPGPPMKLSEFLTVRSQRRAKVT